MPTEVPVDRVAVECADPLARAEDWPADRLIRPSSRGEEIEHEVVRRVLDRANLLHDDVLLALELVRVELAVGENVAEDVERQSATSAPRTRAK